MIQILRKIIEILRDVIGSPAFAGAAGGIAPAVVTIADLMMSTPSPTNHVEIGAAYFGGMPLLAIIGAAIVFFLGENEIKKAFFLGISAPAMVHTAINLPTQNQAKGAHLEFRLVSSAYAREPIVQGVTGSNGERYVQVASQNSASDFQAVLLDGQGKEVDRFAITPNENSLISIADNVTSIRFQKGTDSSSIYDIKTSDSIQVFSVSVASSEQYGFFQALGQPPAVKKNITVNLTDLPSARLNAVGWIDAGSIGAGNIWSSKYLDLRTTGFPQPGQTTKMLAALDLRAQASLGSNWVAYLRPGQQVQLMQVKSDPSGTRSWLQVKVLRES